jgi:hypothetical protein
VVNIGRALGVLPFAFIVFSAWGSQNISTPLYQLPAGTSVTLTAPLNFAAGQMTQYYLEPTFFGEILDRNLRQPPKQGDSYCTIDRNPNETAAQTITPQKFDITAVRTIYDPDTGANQGTEIDFVSGSLKIWITCLDNMVIKTLDVPSAAPMQDGEVNYAQPTLDGDDANVADFNSIFNGVFAQL